MKKIVVVGLGYVGISNAILLAKENEVIGVDTDQTKVTLLNEGTSPVEDEEATRYLQETYLNLSATTKLENAVKNADYVIISTPTNYDPNKDFFDTSTVTAVAHSVTKLSPQSCIVIKSTIPVGYTRQLRKDLNNNNILFSPEFLREGSALRDNLYPSRIIIGDNSQSAQDFGAILKNGALSTDIPIIFTGPEEAEAVKLFANTYLAMRVAYFNEMDTYAMSHGLNCRDIVNGVSSDPRIGDFYNNPSFGYGGYCLPKDSKQLLANFNETPQNIIQAVVQSNDTRMDYLIRNILQKKPKIVGVYRLVMKTGSDNFRDSAVSGLIERLKENKIQVVIYEPIIKEDIYQKIPVYKNLKEFSELSDIIVANRTSPEIEMYSNKLFTRDISGRD